MYNLDGPGRRGGEKEEGGKERRGSVLCGWTELEPWRVGEVRIWHETSCGERDVN